MRPSGSVQPVWIENLPLYCVNYKMPTELCLKVIYYIQSLLAILHDSSS